VFVCYGDPQDTIVLPHYGGQAVQVSYERRTSGQIGGKIRYARVYKAVFTTGLNPFAAETPEASE